jgi:uncharacterized protein with NRDE domain
MCVVALAWRPGGWGNGTEGGSRGPHLVVIANRDEFHRRASASLDVLDDRSLLVGGRDLEKHGGWLWASATGRLAAVTNVRVSPRAKAGSAASSATATAQGEETATESRGGLVSSFATNGRPTGEFLRELRDRAHLYGRFNLLVYDGRSLGYASNVPSYTSRSLPPGVYGLSNASLNTPWPKTVRIKSALDEWLVSTAAAGREVAPLFEALGDRSPVPDDQLPDTGVGLELERALAPPFIRGAAYGTRCSSVVTFTDEEMMFAERRFGVAGDCTGETVVTIPRGHRRAER